MHWHNSPVYVKIIELRKVMIIGSVQTISYFDVSDFLNIKLISTSNYEGKLSVPLHIDIS